MPLAAQCVQSIGDLFLIRIFHRSEDVGGNHDDDENDDENDDDRPERAGTAIERTSSREVSSWLSTAARMLQKQWPRQDRDTQQPPHSEPPSTDNEDSGNKNHVKDTDDGYYRKLIVHHDKTFPRYSLSCSYVFLKQRTATHKSAKVSSCVVLGHGRLTECYESAGGNAVALTYILIDRAHRGNGHGSTLVRLLEQETTSQEKLGCQYHFVYLWCKATTAPFYQQSGYLPSRNRVSLHRPCLKSLTATSVQSIEDIFRRRRNAPGTNNKTTSEDSTVSAARTDDNNTVSNTSKKLETIVLLPTSSSSQSNKDTKNETGDCEQPVEEDDVWLRKRLVDHVASICISEQDRRSELQQFVVASSTSNTARVVSNDGSTNTIVVEENNNTNCRYQFRWNPHVPWQMQIGPTCGLTAIRMIRDYYLHDKTNASHNNREREGDGSTPGASSLLADAQRRGYTNDGEMFDANGLRDLMRDQLVALAATSTSFPSDTGAASDASKDDTVAVMTRETSSLSIEEIDSTVRNKGLWILPYDSNPRTKLPGKFRGQHAHWGIVVGILYDRTKPQNDASTTTSAPSDNVTVHLIVQHSLNSRWAIAPIEDWFDSNRQLLSVNEDKFALGKEENLNLKNKIIQVLLQ